MNIRVNIHKRLRGIGSGIKNGVSTSVTGTVIQRLAVATPLKWKVLCCMALELFWHDIHIFLKALDRFHIFELTAQTHIRGHLSVQSHSETFPWGMPTSWCCENVTKVCLQPQLNNVRKCP